MSQLKKEPELIIKSKLIKLIFCVYLAFFWVIFIWGFWSNGVYSLGINFFVFLSLFLTFFIWSLYKEIKFSNKDLLWIIPFILIISSFLIYDNPFLKKISFVIFLPLLSVFYNYSLVENKEKKYWDFKFLLGLFAKLFYFFGQIVNSIKLYTDWLLPKDKDRKTIVFRVIFGLALFLFIAFILVIPLLKSADLEFAQRIDNIFLYISLFFSNYFLYKLLFFIGFSIFLLSILLSWSKKINNKNLDDFKKTDSIISGIFLGGILILYLLFLWVQFERLFIGALPFDFKEVETLVKSGFWQLFFLSIINIFVYLIIYKKTNPLVQYILTIFTLSSFLLLFSATYRIVLYVKYYGFSYEKFFAFYTVIYFILLFLYLLIILFIKKKFNILKFLVFLFIWMYSIITIVPVENIIFKSNLKLYNIQDSRINLLELTMLSPDVLSSVKNYKSLEIENWETWINGKESIIKNKDWYELSINNIIYLNKLK